MPTSVWVALVAVGLIAGFAVGYIFRRNASEGKINRAEETAKKMIDEARASADAKRRESVLEAKAEILQARDAFDQESREKRVEIQRVERRVLQREENLDRKVAQMEAKEDQIAARDEQSKALQEEARKLVESKKGELEKVANMSRDEARAELIEEMLGVARHDAALLVRDIEARAREEGEKKARNIIGLSIQKCASDHTADITVSTVSLPNDEMKGRIIGREGRNIRALETATGVDLIIDDTPEAVVISAFDPVRREVARQALEKLIMDGRIHPTRIEELVERAQRDVEASMREAGEGAVLEVGVHNLHPELVKILGRLKYRTSYGQNVLRHSVEVAHLSALMAAELGADVNIARRAGLLHDLGKALDHEIELPHAQISADFCKKYRESADVVHAVSTHHNDSDPETIEAVLVQAADAISASRPGARREQLQNYIKRLEMLEQVAAAFPGVEKAFAIQAGREVRVMVQPQVVSDAGMAMLAREIAKKIEEDMEYPGQIRVSLVREVRVSDTAK